MIKIREVSDVMSLLFFIIGNFTVTIKQKCSAKDNICIKKTFKIIKKTTKTVVNYYDLRYNLIDIKIL